MEELLIGLDIGTSVIKGVLATPDGKIVAHAGVNYPTNFPKPGWAEQEPLCWLLRSSGGIIETQTS
jgi:sugar (pentulose or hexulose) kinase